LKLLNNKGVISNGQGRKACCELKVVPFHLPKERNNAYNRPYAGILLRQKNKGVTISHNPLIFFGSGARI
ncbi:MAG: hypothetical protein SV487_09365, partial [Thermodesulfobacteriota bacterium]|nr:hypothetical protein [Thermodesulfobacteriota bacterium]